LNYIDIILLVVLVVGFILGFKDGIIRKLIGMLGLVVAIVLAFVLSDYVGGFLVQFFNDERSLANAVAGLLIFFSILSITALIKRLLQPADKVNNMINQLLGGFFGTIQIAIFLSGFLLFFRIFDFPDENIRNKSFMYGKVYGIIPTVIDLFIDENKSAGEYFKEFNLLSENNKKEEKIGD